MVGNCHGSSYNHNASDHRKIGDHDHAPSRRQKKIRKYHNCIIRIHSPAYGGRGWFATREFDSTLGFPGEGPVSRGTFSSLTKSVEDHNHVWNKTCVCVCRNAFWQGARCQTSLESTESVSWWLETAHRHGARRREQKDNAEVAWAITSPCGEEQQEEEELKTF